MDAGPRGADQFLRAVREALADQQAFERRARFASGLNLFFGEAKEFALDLRNSVRVVVCNECHWYGIRFRGLAPTPLSHAELGAMNKAAADFRIRLRRGFGAEHRVNDVVIVSSLVEQPQQFGVMAGERDGPRGGVADAGFGTVFNESE